MSEAAENGGASRAAIALWISLAVFTVLRALLAFVPSMWGWGFNTLRFVSPIPGWTLWVLSAVALLPALGRPSWRALEAAGGALGRQPGLVHALSGISGAVLAWTFPDVVYFVGDSLVRLGSTDPAADPAVLFPQALPLDVFFHLWLPGTLADWIFLDAAVTARALGALEAGLVAMLAVGWGRTLGLRGAVALAAGAVVLFGGYLGVMTGYRKSAAELALLTVAVGVLGLRVVRGDRGPGPVLALGACAAAGFALHRSALAWLPALGLVVWYVARTPARRPSIRRPLAIIGALLPTAVLIALSPRIFRIMLQVDPVHLAPPDHRSEGLLRTMFAGVHLADAINLLGLLSPLALVVVAAAAGSRWRPPPGRGGELLFLASLALPWIGLLVMTHPVQGLFRDWDCFVATGVSVSLVSAWWVASVLTRARAWAWLSVPLTLGAMAPTTQWLLHNADLDHGLGRVETYLREPPERSSAEKGRQLEFVGLRTNQLARWDQSADALRRAAELTPRPRILMVWAVAEQARGDGRLAQDIYRRMVTIAPDDARGWDGLANVSWKLGDWVEARRAILEVQRLLPGDQVASRILERLDRGDTARVEPAR